MSPNREDVLGAAPSAFERRLFRILSHRPDVDGRVVVAVVLAVYFLIVAIPRLIWGVDVWRFLGVPTGPSPFFDTRNLTAALECRRLGYDPLRESPCDPWERPLNYPRVWLVLRWLGLNESHTDILAIALIALFLASVFILVQRLTLGGGIVTAIALCSPSVMFAIERGNMDIVIFALLAMAVVAWRSAGRWGDVASPLIVLIAATAKIYPVFAIPAFLFARRHRAALVAVGCAIAFGVYALVTIGDIAANARIAPQGQHHAFGVRILSAAIYHRFVPDRWQGGALTKQLIAVIPLIVAAPMVWTSGRRRLPEDDPDVASWERLSFYIGTLVFLGTFAVGNNFDYRLVFLLLTLPQLTTWAGRAEEDPRRWLGGATLLVVLVLLWIGALSEPLALADELVTWATVVLLAVLLAASVPRLGAIWSALIRAEHDGRPIVASGDGPYPST